MNQAIRPLAITMMAGPQIMSASSEANPLLEVI
jgi:hypothetical protein